MSIANASTGAELLESDDVIVLSPHDQIERALADDLDVRVTGWTADGSEFLEFKIRYDSAPNASHTFPHTMLAEDFAPAMLSSETARGRFAETVDRLYPGGDDVRANLEALFDELAEAYVDGELLFVDDVAADIIRSTRRVEYRPAAKKQWSVTLTDDVKRTATFGSAVAEFSADDWAGDATGAVNREIPTSLRKNPFVNNQQCWRTVRSVWQLLAETDTS